MARDGYDPLPTYTPPMWQRHELQEGTDENQERPSAISRLLICISPPAHSYLNSSFANVDRFQQREEKPFLRIHPQDAMPRQIQDGTLVRVANALGELTLTVQITTKIIPGTVLAPGIWWNKFSPDGRNINRITPQDETDMGAGATFYDTLVTVELVGGKATIQNISEDEDAIPMAAD